MISIKVFRQWLTPILAACGLVGIGTVWVTIAVAVGRLAPVQARSVPRTEAVQSAPTAVPASKVQPAWPPNDATVQRWEPLVRRMTEAQIKVFCDGVQGFPDLRINELLVEPDDLDGRKVPWLWRCTAEFEIVVMPVEGARGSSTEVCHAWYRWTSLSRLGDGQDWRQCWQEAEWINERPTARRHFREPEWNQEFRDKVMAAFRRYQGTRVQPKDSVHDRSIREIRTLAAKLGVSPVELSEIVQAPE